MNFNKRVVAAIAAAVLALLGIVSLVLYANDADDRAFQGTKLITAIQVVDEVPVDTKAEDLGAAVKVVKLPKAAVPATALKTLDSVTGKVATAELVPGEILVSGRFGAAGEATAGGKVTIPKGLQELTIKVASVRALDGKLASGDTVGVAASYDDERRSSFTLNKVLVLSAGQAAGNADGTVSDDIVVRVAVTSQNAIKIVHAAEFGHLYFTKQNQAAEVAPSSASEGDVLK